ncbi:hypothetical protein N8J89_03675 [Crossiella sp. CA-258035]|uniref:hypothetical protein n=1 Tax=Crossiella sp. CA-258035 TaxID=2981138 RepID=UPI0024BD17EA|nr:hypothetical protein [Crossiella sp. CA-258035]WHT20184.1 hypothetical protein N8J89_03675 [Crossiella sp. CA-258035]
MTWAGVPKGEPTAVFSGQDSGVTPVCVRCRGEGLSNLLAELLELKAENVRLAKNLEDTLKVNRRLRDRLSLSASRHAQAGDRGATLKSSTHSVLADRYQDLIAQDVYHLLLEHLGVSVVRDAPIRLAREISTMCRYLFIDGSREAGLMCGKMGMDPARFLVPMRDIAEKVTELRAQAHGVEWSFEAVSGRLLSPDIQQPWGQCDPRVEVEFVVMPGYRADGRVYAKQQVFTKQRYWQSL